MVNKAFATLFTLLLISFTVLNSGCGGAAPKNSDDEANAAKLDMSIEKIMLLNAVDTEKTPGGYYSLIKLKLVNNTKTELEVKLKDFSIKEKSATEEDTYVLSPEIIPYYLYEREFGQGTKQNQLIEQASVKPQFEFTQDIFFALPNNAEIIDYELLYAPDELKLDLEESELEDKREEE